MQYRKPPTKTVSDFIIKLKESARKCNFGEQLESGLIQQLAFGVELERTRDKLDDIENITFDRACEIARLEEKKADERQQMKNDREEAVHKAGLIRNKKKISNKNQEE